MTIEIFKCEDCGGEYPRIHFVFKTSIMEAKDNLKEIENIKLEEFVNENISRILFYCKILAELDVEKIKVLKLLLNEYELQNKIYIQNGK